MKKTILILLAGALLAVSSCSKEGATGPTGPSGPSGPSGSTGPSGSNASAAYQLTFAATNWGQIGTSGVQGAHLNAGLISPYLSYDSVGTGAVLVYSSGGYAPSGGLQAWNFTFYNNSLSYVHQYNWFDGGINADIFESDYNFPPTETYNFTLVVIPGAKSLPASVNRNDYNSVVAYYHPRTVK